MSTSEDPTAPRLVVPFSLDPITQEMEGGRYLGTILPTALADLAGGYRSVQQPTRGTGSGRSGGINGTGGGSGGTSRSGNISDRSRSRASL